MAVQINTDIMKQYNPEYDPTKPVGVSGVTGTQSSAETAGAYNQEAQKQGRQDWETAYRTDVLKLPNEQIPTVQSTNYAETTPVVAKTTPATPITPTTTTTTNIEAPSGLSEKPVTPKATETTAPIDYNVGTGREAEINANLAEGFKNDLGIQKAVNTGDYTAFKQAYNYDTADQAKKQLLDSFFQSRQPKDSSEVFNQLIAGQTGYSPEFKQSANYKMAEKRFNDYNQFAGYNSDQFSTVLSNGYLLPWTNLYNDLLKNPKAKENIEKANLLNTINKTPVNIDKAVENTMANIVDNTPIGKALADGYISAEEANQLTTTPEIQAIEAKKNKLADDVANQQNLYDNIRINTEKELSGTGATDTEVEALIASRQKELRGPLSLSINLYNNAVGALADKKTEQSNLFGENLKLYQSKQEATQKAQQLAEERAYNKSVLDEQRTYAENKAKQDLLMKEGDINSTDPYIKQKAVQNAVDRVLETYKDIPMVRSREQMIADITNAVNAGQELWQAITQNIITPIQNKPEFKAKLEAEKAKGIKYQEMGGKLYKVENGVLTDTGISTIEPAKSSFETIGKDAEGNEIKGFVNPATQTVTPYTQTGTAGLNTDLRNSSYVQQYPNEASFKNNNPAGITWNANFDKNTGVAKALSDAGITYSKGTARPTKEGGNYVQFETIGDGMKARQVVFGTTYGNQSLSEALQSWKEGSNRNSATKAYANGILSEAGLKGGQKFNDLTEEQKNALTMAQIKRESSGLYKVLSSQKPVEKIAGEYSKAQKNVMDKVESITEANVKALKAVDLDVTDWANYLASSGKVSQKQIDNINKEKDSFNRLPQASDWNSAQGVQEWLKSVEKTDLSGPAIQGLISNYAKILDPTSVVRESEYAMAQKGSSQGVIDQTKQQIATFISGGSNVLSKEAQAVLKEAMQNRLNAMKTAYLNLAKTRVKQAMATGVPLTLEQLTGIPEAPATKTKQSALDIFRQLKGNK